MAGEAPSYQNFDPSNLTSLFGTGLGVYNQGQIYGNLQNALKAIGPTNLQGWNLGGPGGMSTGFNPATGSANINLGALNPAYGGFAGAAGAGANSYNAGLPSFLSGNALSTLNPAMAALGGAYGSYGAGISAANSNLPAASGANFGADYSNILSNIRGTLAPGIQQSAYGLQNTLFGNGVADSTGAASGSLASQNFGRGVAQADANAQLNAFQQALARQNSAATNYGTLSSSANGILANAFNNFGNTNQLISGLNTAGLNNAGTAAQGAGALNTLGLNNYNAALQSGVAQGTVRNQSLFPYASVATALSQTPSALGLGASALSQIGANGGNPLSSLFNAGRNVFGGTNPFGDFGSLGGVPTNFSGGAFNAAFDSSGLNSIPGLDLGFNAAGGGAAAGAGADAGLGAEVASGAQATSNAALAGYSASAGADAAAGAGADAAGAAGGSAAGSGIMDALATLGPEAAAALAIAGPIYGMFSPAVTRNGDFNSRMQSYINAGPGAFANAGKQYGGSIYNGYNGLYWDPQYTNYMAATSPFPSMPGGGGGQQGGNILGYK